MFEKGIRGGFSGVLGPRHVKAYNKFTSNYNNGNRILDDNEALECIKITARLILVQRNSNMDLFYDVLRRNL
jgi:hypothetical protein